MPDCHVIKFAGDKVPEAHYRVVAQVDPFKLDCRVEFDMVVSWTVDDLVRHLQPDAIYHDHAVVIIGDILIPREYWSSVRPKSGATVYVRMLPSGGKGAGIRLIFAALAVVAAFYLGPLATGYFGSQLAGAAVAAAASTAINAIGAAIAGPSNPNNGLSGGSDRFNTSPSFQISSARNRANRFGPIPAVLGTHKSVPPYAGLPYTESEGDTQFLRLATCWGYGPVSLADVRIGNTAIAGFEDVETENDLTGVVDTLTLFPNAVSQENLNIPLDTTFTQRTTSIDTEEIGITVTFPRGIYYQAGTGDRRDVNITLTADYRLEGDVSWTSWFVEVVNGNVTKAYFFSKRLTGLASGKYEVRLKRDEENPDPLVVTGAVWTALRAFTGQDPVNLAGIAKSAYRIKATDQLNGVVDELNAVVSSLIPTWTGSTWAGTNATSNPAAIYRYVLTGAPNERALDSSLVDDANLGEWYDFCETEGFTFDQVIDYRISVRELLQNIAAAGRATPKLIDDQWGVIIDQPRTTVVQHFTPRNTRNFSGRIAFPEVPHAYRVRFLNKNKEYREDERIVYDDGYTAANATKFELLELVGQTDPDNVYKMARYFMAGLRLRPELFTFEVDVEHIVCTRGDLIRFNHDVPQIGLGYGRIKAISGTDITIDNEITMEAGGSYGLRVRKSDGTTFLTTVTTAAGNQSTITVASATGLAVGDLYMFGTTSEESLELIITDIEPGDDLSATIMAVPYSPEIYNSAITIPAYTSILSDPVSASFIGPAAPIITNIVSDESALFKNADGSVKPAIILYVAPGAPNTAFDGTVTRTEGYRVRFRENGSTERWSYISNIDADASSIQVEPVDNGQGYDIEVQAFDEAGQVSEWTRETNHIVIGALARPATVDTFTMNTVGDQAYLEWTYTAPIDLDGFEIRYHPDQNVTTWTRMTPIALKVPRRSRSYTVPNRSGSYGIKPFDILENRSATALYINSTLEDPESVNVVQTETDNPTFAGTKTDVFINGTELQLDTTTVMADWTTLAAVSSLSYGTGQGFALEGFYEMSGNDIDLSEVYTSRILAGINAGVTALTGLMSGWSTLSSVEFIAGAGETDGTYVELQVAYSADDNLSPTFTAWQPFVVGEYTARWFKFRLRFVTDNEGVSPTVDALTVTIDMPDRIIHGEDIASGAGTKSVVFSPYLRQLNKVGITAQNMATGDYFEVSNKTRTGFDVVFKNSGGTAVDRTFDYDAIGFGRERGT